MRAPVGAAPIEPMAPPIVESIIRQLVRPIAMDDDIATSRRPRPRRRSKTEPEVGAGISSAEGNPDQPLSIEPAMPASPQARRCCCSAPASHWAMASSTCGRRVAGSIS